MKNFIYEYFDMFSYQKGPKGPPKQENLSPPFYPLGKLFS